MNFTNIKTRRLHAKPKIGLEELSAIAGVSIGAISGIERGCIPNPGAQTVEKIEKALTYLEIERDQKRKEISENGGTHE